MKKLILALVAFVSAIAINAKTLVVYYSYTNNVERIVNELKTQIECDVIEVEPAEKGLDNPGLDMSPLQTGIYIINQGGKSTKIKL